jgi:hypothetical protein
MDSYPSVNKQILGVQEVKASGRENKVLLQTYENSESGDHIKSDEISKLTGDNHEQAVQEGVQEYINSETEGHKITEKDTMKEEKTGILPRRTRRQPLKRNKDFLW